MNLRNFTATFLVVLCLSCFSVCDPVWAVSWEQPPLINEPGQLDVQLTGLTLADDFPGTVSGPITNISVWGVSFNNGEAGPVALTLAIYENSANLPGTQLWSKTFASGEYALTPYSGMTTAAFLDPATGSSTLHDSPVLQVDFSIPADEAFQQQQGQTYWLAVYASVEPGYVPVGARNTSSPWGEEAVYWDGASWQNDIGADLSLRVTATPLPASLLLLGSGLLGLLAVGLRSPRSRD